MNKDMYIESAIKGCILAMMVCLLASCGGSKPETQLTGEGIFGDLPNYITQFVDIRQQWVDETEFEDNKDKQREIFQKYDDKAKKIFTNEQIEAMAQKFRKDTIPIISHAKVDCEPGQLIFKDFDLSIDKGIKFHAQIKARYSDRHCWDGTCFLLDENDSIVGISIVNYEGKYAKINLQVNTKFKDGKRDNDIVKLVFYSLDKAKKVLIPSGDEARECLARYEKHLENLSKELKEEGIIGKISGLNESGKEAIAAEEKKEEADPAKPGDIDLAYHELRGKVKSMRYTKYENTSTYTFSENGKWLTYNGRSLANALSDVKRDSKKRITKYTEGDYDCIDTYNILYNPNTGWVSQLRHEGEGQDITTYTYDDKGNITKAVCTGEYVEMGAEEPEKINDTTTYTYEKFDDQGNWTKRSGKRSDGEHWIETRTITYYQ